MAEEGEEYLNAFGTISVAEADGAEVYEFLYGGACTGCHFNGGKSCSLLGKSFLCLFVDAQC
jgi:hypothetical protein